MNVVVFVKSIPDPNGDISLGEDFLVKREGDGTLDPGDEFAIEAALQLVEADPGEVVAISMGPDGAAAAVRRALSMGVDRGVLVSDDALRGADALVTARVLATAVRRSSFDLVLAGVESTDGYTGTVPITVAELLDLPGATFARRLEVAGGIARIERQTEAGYDVVETPLPALVTLTAGATEPRYPTLKGIMQAKSKPMETMTIGDLGLSGDDLPFLQHVVAVEPAAEKSAGEVVQAGPDTAGRIADFLAEAKAI